MDVPTILVSAGVSAVVGALVSLAAVSQVTIRRSRAERAEAARRAVRAMVGPLLLDVRRYRAEMSAGLQREQDTGQGEDYVTVSRLLTVAADLSCWRRTLVLRRSRRIFGRAWTDLAELSPADPSSPGSLFAPILQAQYRAARLGAVTESRPPPGLLHRAFCQPPNGALLPRLDRELRRLAASR